MILKRLVPNNCTDSFLVKGYFDKDPDICQALLKRLRSYYETEYKNAFQTRKKASEILYKEAVNSILRKIDNKKIFVNNTNELIGISGKPLKKGELNITFIMCVDALLIKGYYNNVEEMGNALHDRLKKYYEEKYYGVFQVQEEDADEIYQMAIKAFLINIRMRRIFVNEDDVLIGTNGMPFSGKLTTYFMSIADNMHSEWLRIKRKGGGKQLPKDLPESPDIPWSGYSFPYEKEKDGILYWYINGKSTGVEVKVSGSNNTFFKQMPYIGADVHWWVGSGKEAKDLGSLYNEFLYDDKQISLLSSIARRIANMAHICKHLLTLTFYYRISDDEIIKIMPNFKNKNVLKTRRYKCLEQLRGNTRNLSC